MGNDEAALKMKDGQIINGSTIARSEKHWQSSVFGGPQEQQIKRKVLGKPGAGIDGFYGDNDDPATREKKTTFAGEFS